MTTERIRPRLSSAEQFEREYAERNGLSVAELRAFGRVVRPCSCGSPLCQGWQSINRDLAEELDRERGDG